MRRLRGLVKLPLLAALAGTVTAGAAFAADPTIDDLYAKAKGSSLTLAVHSIDGMEQWAQAFIARFPDVKVDLTVINPSKLAPRVLTEQQGGIYAWDVYVGGTGNMENLVEPAGGLVPVADYLLLPDVKDKSNWLQTGKDDTYVFTYTGWAERTIFANTDRLKELGVDRIAQFSDLLNPKLKGEIAIRDPGRQNNGSYTIAATVQQMNDDAKGLAIVHDLLSKMDALIVDNAEQVTNPVITGDKAVVVGGGPDIVSRCILAGGCTNVVRTPLGPYINYRGLVVFKNLPHPDATKLLINWLLSKEGQEAYVKVWAKYNTSGAVSLRKDVAPDPGQVDNLPTEDQFKTLYDPTTDRGSALADAVMKISKETAGQ